MIDLELEVVCIIPYCLQIVNQNRIYLARGLQLFRKFPDYHLRTYLDYFLVKFNSYLRYHKVGF